MILKSRASRPITRPAKAALLTVLTLITIGSAVPARADGNGGKKEDGKQPPITFIVGPVHKTPDKQGKGGRPHHQ